jgi:hypothetical protein
MVSPNDHFLEGDDFDWNTKSVYVVFQYEGMRDGTAWSVVWTRYGEEIAREDNRWNLEEYGHSGTRWATLFDANGNVLFGGDYTVSLYIEDDLQVEAPFRIRFYLTPTPAW